MTDFDQSIFDDPTLGEANHLSFLDETEAQAKENRQAAIEGRQARKLIPWIRFGPNANVGTPPQFEEIPEVVIPEVKDAKK